ncbi:hypothetical protein ABW19_dt0209330 [Dactylella cylindrospora]|nr:hypothetical protein ABW19_dt0209330 [Dactylella cylindrospora]
MISSRSWGTKHDPVKGLVIEKYQQMGASSALRYSQIHEKKKKNSKTCIEWLVGLSQRSFLGKSQFFSSRISEIIAREEPPIGIKKKNACKAPRLCVVTKFFFHFCGQTARYENHGSPLRYLFCSLLWLNPLSMEYIPWAPYLRGHPR